jgi:hypothetical protein
MKNDLENSLQYKPESLRIVAEDFTKTHYRLDGVISKEFEKFLDQGVNSKSDFLILKEIESKASNQIEKALSKHIQTIEKYLTDLLEMPNMTKDVTMSYFDYRIKKFRTFIEEIRTVIQPYNVDGRIEASVISFLSTTIIQWLFKNKEFVYNFERKEGRDPSFSCMMFRKLFSLDNIALKLNAIGISVLANQLFNNQNTNLITSYDFKLIMYELIDIYDSFHKSDVFINFEVSKVEVKDFSKIAENTFNFIHENYQINIPEQPLNLDYQQRLKTSGYGKRTPKLVSKDVRAISFLTEDYTDKAMYDKKIISMLVIKQDDSLWGYGNNSHGNLGLGHLDYVPSEVKIMDDVKKVVSAKNYFVVLKNDGTVWTMGIPEIEESLNFVFKFLNMDLINEFGLSPDIRFISKDNGLISYKGENKDFVDACLRILFYNLKPQLISYDVSDVQVIKTHSPRVMKVYVDIKGKWHDLVCSEFIERVTMSADQVIKSVMQSCDYSLSPSVTVDYQKMISLSKRLPSLKRNETNIEFSLIENVLIAKLKKEGQIDTSIVICREVNSVIIDELSAIYIIDLNGYFYLSELDTYEIISTLLDNEKDKTEIEKDEIDSGIKFVKVLEYARELKEFNDGVLIVSGDYYIKRIYYGYDYNGEAIGVYMDTISDDVKYLQSYKDYIGYVAESKAYLVNVYAKVSSDAVERFYKMTEDNIGGFEDSEQIITYGDWDAFV